MGGKVDRRTFVAWLWTGLGLAALAELGWIGASLLRARRRLLAAGDDIIVCGPLTDFPPGSVTAFPEGRFYLARLDDGGLLALYRECTHLGCTVPWSAAEKRFICPCHASSFDITGQVLSAPAPRPLDLVEVRVENGIVKVNVARRTRRSAFDPGQVVHA